MGVSSFSNFGMSIEVTSECEFAYRKRLELWVSKLLGKFIFTSQTRGELSGNCPYQVLTSMIIADHLLIIAKRN